MSLGVVPYGRRFLSSRPPYLDHARQRTSITAIQTNLLNASSADQTRHLPPVVTPENDPFNAFVQSPSSSHSPGYASWVDQLNHRIDQRRLRPLDGVALGIKDNIATHDFPTTCASALLAQFTSPFDATVVQLLRQAGALIVGKTNLDEFGMGSTTTHSVHGEVVNPVPFLNEPQSGQPLSKTDIHDAHHSSRLSAGGSSGGSAAAVASFLCDAALGTDTGGSVRLPASYCGVVGFKPSYGRISRWGVVAYANSLDTVGILTRTVTDARHIYRVLAQPDPQDESCQTAELREKILAKEEADTPLAELRRSWNGENLRGCRVGIPQEYMLAELDTGMQSAWQQAAEALAAKGATIIPVSCPHTRYALSSYYILAPAEASSNLARYDGVRYGHAVETEALSAASSSVGVTPGLYSATRTHGFGAEVQRRILLGTYVLTAGAFEDYFVKAQKVRRLVQQDFDRVFRTFNPLHIDPSPSGNPNDHQHNYPKVDCLLTPTALSHAPTLASLRGQSELTSYINDVMTVPASLAGLPAISVPFSRIPCREKAETGSTHTLPIGLQLLAQYGDESLLLSVAEALESSASDLC
ncbi:Trimeric GatFAB AmidoTransferase(AdT) complex subunit [Dispira parvispora]|uniref:Glutamyl-tRNA(Gln) amidotransferase subunit A, mitochondrial n=1 Tax=Dispira parvispora TaxID=1520584 RepID=A0A9W8E9F5_9FUNG|nr:Trimeric GatFAB AmidoTransferase(AdT) complex subunit [Dispira parvispora]